MNAIEKMKAKIAAQLDGTANDYSTNEEKPQLLAQYPIPPGDPIARLRASINKHLGLPEDDSIQNKQQKIAAAVEIEKQKIANKLNETKIREAKREFETAKKRLESLTVLPKEYDGLTQVQMEMKKERERREQKMKEIQETIARREEFLNKCMEDGGAYDIQEDGRCGCTLTPGNRVEIHEPIPNTPEDIQESDCECGGDAGNCTCEK